MDESAVEIAIAQANERLRQERETFDEEKEQYRKWFRVKHVMGWTIALMLPTILVVAAAIIFNSKSFDILTVRIATGALLADTLGTVLTLYKLILGSQPNTTLRPVTVSPEREDLIKFGATPQVLGTTPAATPASSSPVQGENSEPSPPSPS